MVFLKVILILAFGIVLILLNGILALNSDDTLLSKFHQNAYKLRDQRADFADINWKLVNSYEVKTFKFNRTVTAFNITFSFKKDFDDKMDSLVQLYKRASNEYRLFPARFRINFCKYFNKNIFGLLNTLKCGNLTSCIMKKDVVYHICNFVIDETKFPPLVPTGEFKAEVTGMFGDEKIAVMNGYAEIYLPNKMYEN